METKEKHIAVKKVREKNKRGKKKIHILTQASETTFVLFYRL